MRWWPRWARWRDGGCGRVARPASPRGSMSGKADRVLSTAAHGSHGWGRLALASSASRGTPSPGSCRQRAWRLAVGLVRQLAELGTRSHWVRQPGTNFRVVVLAVLVSGLTLSTGCGARRSVTRLVEGREVRGRVVSQEAYALYARAAYLEASGQTARALVVYDRVIDYDPRSVQAWTRVGALQCGSDPSAAERAFLAGEAVDAEYEPLWRERARCALQRGESRLALQRAERAAQLDPNQVETSLLVIRSQEACGELEAARHWMRALVLRTPYDPVVWQHALAFAERHQEGALADQARRRLDRLRGSSAPRLAPRVAREAIDRALRDYDLDRARRLAVRAGIPPAEVALRSAALARPKLAREQALLVLESNPRSGDAWVAALVAADLERDVGLLEAVAAALEADPNPLSPLGALLLDELLGRVVGTEAAQAWRAAYGPLPAAEEPLLSDVVGRTPGALPRP